MKHALLITLEAKPGKEIEIEDFFQTQPAFSEIGQTDHRWMALRMSESKYGIFNMQHSDKEAEGDVMSLIGNISNLFNKPPQIQKMEVLTLNTIA